MLLKIVIGLLLTIIVGALSFSQIGDGVFKFIPQSDAQRIIEESTSVEEALDMYALKNDGRVDIGDPTLCENGVDTVESGKCETGQKTLHFIRQDELLKLHVGTEFDRASDPWRMNEESGTIERVVASEESCKEINHIRLGTSTDEDVPECGTAEGDEVYCCVSDA